MSDRHTSYRGNLCWSGDRLYVACLQYQKKRYLDRLKVTNWASEARLSLTSLNRDFGIYKYIYIYIWQSSKSLMHVHPRRLLKNVSNSAGTRNREKRLRNNDRKRKKRQRATETECERLSSQVFQSQPSSLIFSVAVVSLLCQCAVRHTYTPYIIDLFILENPKSYSQVTKRIQRNAISTRALV